MGGVSIALSQFLGHCLVAAVNVSRLVVLNSTMLLRIKVILVKVQHEETTCTQSEPFLN